MKSNVAIGNAIRRLSQSPTITAWLYSAVNTLGNVLLLPIAAFYLPDADVALWATIALIQGIGLLADFGVRATAVRQVAYRLASDDITSAISAISDIRKAYFGIAAVGAFIVALGSYIVAKRFHQEAAVYGISVIAASASICITLCATPALVSLEGRGLIFIANKTLVIASIVRFGGGIAAVMLFKSAAPIFCAQMIAASLQFILLSREERKLNTQLCDTKFNPAFLRSLFATSLRMGVTNLGAYFVQYGTALAASQLPNISDVAKFQLTVRAVNLVTTFATAVVATHAAGMAKLRIREDLQGIRALFLRRIRLALLTGICGCAAIVCFSLVAVWHEESPLLWGWPLYVLMLGAVLEIHHSAHALCYITTDRIPFAALSIANAVAITSFGVATAPTGNVALLATIGPAIQLIGSNWYPVQKNLNSLQWNVFDYWRALAKRVKHV